MRPENRKFKLRKAEYGRREIENGQGREDNRPNKEHVYEYVDGVAVILAVEGEVLLQIK